MKNFLNTVILDNTVLNYLICFGTILVALLLKKYLSQYMAGFLFKLLKRTSWNINKTIFTDLLLAPLQVFLIVLVTFIALDKLRFPQAFIFEIHRVTSKDITDGIATAIIIIAFIWLLLRMIDFIAFILEKKTNLTADLTDSQLIVFFKDFLKVIVGIIGILLIIHFSFDKDIGALLAGFGIIGAAMALAARESLENLIASFIIFFDKPFNIGDLVKVQGYTGTVERIGLRSTRIRTDSKTYVTVPNKQMVDSIMDNLTLRTQRRADLRLEISLATAAEQLEQLLNELKRITAQPLIISRVIQLNDIVTNAYIITVEYYTSAIPLADFVAVRQQVNLEVIKAMAALKIELAGLNTEIKISGPVGEKLF